MVDSVFNVNDNIPDCSIFAPTAGYGADTFVSFVRSTLKLHPDLQQPQLNSSGETVLSYVSSGTFLGSLQPASTDYRRFLHGIITEVNYKFYILGEVDIIEGDRATVEGRRVEVVNAQHWGSEQTECDLRFLGR
jgi:hypothetical protein